jgi:hypothetical protein
VTTPTNPTDPTDPSGAAVPPEADVATDLDPDLDTDLVDDPTLDVLMDRLRTAAATADPVPDLVLETARAALLTRRLDAELAQLVLDSATDDDRLVAVRGAGPDGVRMLSFRTDRVSIEVQVTETESGRSLLGVVTGASGDVEVETDAGTGRYPIDAVGRFSVPDLPPGVVRLHLTADDGTAVTSSWVSA